MADKWVDFLDNVVRSRRDMQEAIKWWLQVEGEGWMFKMAKPFLRPTVERIAQDDAIAYLISDNGRNLRVLLNYMGGISQGAPSGTPFMCVCPSCHAQIPYQVVTCPSCYNRVEWK